VLKNILTFLSKLNCASHPLLWEGKQRKGRCFSPSVLSKKEILSKKNLTFFSPFPFLLQLAFPGHGRDRRRKALCGENKRANNKEEECKLWV